MAPVVKLQRGGSGPSGALRRTGELALATLAALPQSGVLVFDRELRYVLAAGGALERHGYRPEVLEGRRAADVLPGETYGEHAGAYQAALAGRITRFEYTARDGTRTYDVEIAPVVRDGHVIGGLQVARDITEQKAAEEARHVAQEHFRIAFDDAPIGMALVGLDGSWLRVNDALVRMVGHSRDELLSRTFQEITHPDDVQADVALVEETVHGVRSGYEMEKRYVRADGTAVWVLLSVSLVRNRDRRPLHFIAQAQDISERRRLEAELHRRATEDELTGLLNRRGFQRELEAQLRRGRRYDEPATLMLIDLDGFKAVNDTFGHVTGDRLLRHVAEVLRGRLRGTDVIARLGGDEFAVLLPHTPTEGAAEVARALAVELEGRPVEFDGRPIVVRVSAGVTAVIAPDLLEPLLRDADRALYAAKIGGRNRTVTWPEAD
jgi:diguanylate cyclase (GGDEF)-like protein/PAS domain S-box-containing protein